MMDSSPDGPGVYGAWDSFKVYKAEFKIVHVGWRAAGCSVNLAK